jgi:hypothetical protein
MSSPSRSRPGRLSRALGFTDPDAPAGPSVPGNRSTPDDRGSNGDRGSQGARRSHGARRGQRDRPQPPDATVTLEGERAAAGIDGILASLDHDLVGLLPVKKKTEEIAALLLVDRLRRRFGLDAARPNLHMCFTGAPGTGKTTVALRMADLLHRLGYLDQGQLVHAMRDDLVGEYIGQTAPKTKQVLSRAMGGAR